MTWVLQRATRLIEESPEFLRLQMILLLSAPTGDANAAVGQLRQRQREGLRDMLALCFAEPGEPAATEIADRLVDIAAATFEGAFLAAQAGSTAHSRTLAQLVDVLIRMAEDEKSRKAP